MMNDDAELEAALEESARLHAAKTSVIELNSQFDVSRGTLGRPRHHWKDADEQAGVILQLDTINQFAQIMQPVISEFGAPASLCGYFAMAHALLLKKLLPSAVYTRVELLAALSPMWDASIVLPAVRDAVAFTHARRTAWMDAHPADFATPDAKRDYLRAWVANYEISDYLREHGSAGIYFARYNQWVEREAATHEERQRLEEEASLGGQSTPTGAVFEDGDAAFFVETYFERNATVCSPERAFVRPEAFTPTTTPPPVLVADLQGHFATCAALRLTPEGRLSPEGKDIDGEASASCDEDIPTLLVVNTTGSNYADHCAHVFDLCFPPRKPVHVGASQRLSPEAAAHLVPAPHDAPPEPTSLSSPPTCILPDLYLGAHGASIRYAELVALGISHVLNVKGGARTPPPPYNQQLVLASVPLSDFGTSDLEAHIGECLAVIDAAHSVKGGCLVHCSQGMNRSPTVVLAYLICSPRTRWSLRDAWTHVRSRRPCVGPHYLYWEQLERLEQAEHGVARSSLSAEEAGIFLPPDVVDEARLRAAARGGDPDA